jgi:hypothetical protein
MHCCARARIGEGEDLWVHENVAVTLAEWLSAFSAFPGRVAHKVRRGHVGRPAVSSAANGVGQTGGEKLRG